METMMRATDAIKSLRETRLNGLRGPQEFFDVQRVSRPADLSQATSRITYNTRYFSGNYLLIIALLAVYALLSNWWLVVALVFLVGGFSLVNRFGTEPINIAGTEITQKSLYTALFVVGIPLLWWSSPLGTFFWLVGASGVLILGHAMLLEPGIESEYVTAEQV
jgi:hypothetical protein